MSDGNLTVRKNPEISSGAHSILDTPSIGQTLSLLDCIPEKNDIDIWDRKLHCSMRFQSDLIKRQHDTTPAESLVASPYPPAAKMQADIQEYL